MKLHLSKDKDDSVSQLEYSIVIGRLMHLMSCIKPYISYTVNKLSRYTNNPRTDYSKGLMA